MCARVCAESLRRCNRSDQAPAMPWSLGRSRINPELSRSNHWAALANTWAASASGVASTKIRCFNSVQADFGEAWARLPDFGVSTKLTAAATKLGRIHQTRAAFDQIQKGVDQIWRGCGQLGIWRFGPAMQAPARGFNCEAVQPRCVRGGSTAFVLERKSTNAQYLETRTGHGPRRDAPCDCCEDGISSRTTEMRLWPEVRAEIGQAWGTLRRTNEAHPND